MKLKNILETDGFAETDCDLEHAHFVIEKTKDIFPSVLKTKNRFWKVR